MTILYFNVVGFGCPYCRGPAGEVGIAMSAAAPGIPEGAAFGAGAAGGFGGNVDYDVQFSPEEAFFDEKITPETDTNKPRSYFPETWLWDLATISLVSLS